MEEGEEAAAVEGCGPGGDTRADGISALEEKETKRRR